MLALLWAYRFVVALLIVAVVFAFKLNNPEPVYGLSATGGTITTRGDGYKVHTFTSSGTFTPDGSGTVEYLVVAGGGGGGGNGGGGGGGGAGGLKYSASYEVTAQAYTVTIGGGGAGSSSGAGASGSDSVFGSITATGGGGGGARAVAALNGGSGGGAGGSGASSSGKGTGTVGQGKDGGDGVEDAGGGGGGAGAVGGIGSSGCSGSGGMGLSYSTSGASTTYAGGGGGSYNSTSPCGQGGLGGGGKGVTSGTAAVSGTANTGGGGGGGQLAYGAGGNGGSGVVIIVYDPNQGAGGSSCSTSGISTSTGGTITPNGEKWVHTFTSNGTFTPTGSGNVEALVVAGGGGGGGAISGAGGGGGAGGYQYDASLTVTGAVTVTVGGGGTGGTGGTSHGTAGSNSIFSSITATGGGYGATRGVDGSTGGTGGSGGGGANGLAGGAGTGSQGNSGGSGNNDGGGGGGGASAAGATAPSGFTGGNGGNGTANSISGSSVTYGGGGRGGGRGDAGGSPGNGGSGGGGNGSATDNGSNGTANRGGGGGGGAYNSGNYNGGNGGSGIVIVSYTPNVSSSCGSFLIGFEAWMKKVTGIDDERWPTGEAVALLALLAFFSLLFVYARYLSRATIVAVSSSIRRPLNFFGFGNSASNTSILSCWSSNVAGYTRNTTRPGVRFSGNFAMSRKSVSLERMMRDSFSDRAYTSSSESPTGERVASWPSAFSTFTSLFLKFSSHKNFTAVRGNEAGNALSLGAARGEIECGADVTHGDGRPVFENLVNGLSVSQRFENLPHHDARSAERELASANLRIGDDVFVDGDALVHNATSVAQGQTRLQWRCGMSSTCTRAVVVASGSASFMVGFEAWMKKVTDVDGVQGPLVPGSLLVLALLAYYAGAVPARRKPQACAAFDWRFERI